MDTESATYEQWAEGDCAEFPDIDDRDVVIKRAFKGGYKVARSQADGIVFWLDQALNYGPMGSEDYRTAQKTLKIYRGEMADETAKDAAKHDLANLVCAEIWDIWYGENHGKMNVDQFSDMLKKIKQMIRAA